VHEGLLSLQGCKLQIAAGSSAFAGGVHDCYCLLCGSFSASGATGTAAGEGSACIAAVAPAYTTGRVQ
jgi:hypothetical protein